MPNAKYRKGARYEYKAKKELERLGFVVIRAAGSHGPFDLVAIDKDIIYLIQVKAGTTIGQKERKKMELVETPSIVYKEIWTYTDNGLIIEDVK